METLLEQEWDRTIGFVFVFINQILYLLILSGEAVEQATSTTTLLNLPVRWSKQNYSIPHVNIVGYY